MAVTATPEATLAEKYEKIVNGHFSTDGTLKISHPRDSTEAQDAKDEESLLAAIRGVLDELRENYTTKVNSGSYWCCPSTSKLQDYRTSFGVTRDGILVQYFSDRNQEAVVNCSLCTAAAIVRECTGKAWNTTMVAQSTGLKLPDGYGVHRLFVDYSYWETNPSHQAKPESKNLCDQFNDGSNLDQLRGLISWCQHIAGAVFLEMLGGLDNKLKADLAMKKMMEFKEGTVFAVRVSYNGTVHFNFAKRMQVNGQQALIFVDYQTDRVEVIGSRPSVSTRPMAPEGKEISGNDLSNWGMVALAFQPQKPNKIAYK